MADEESKTPEAEDAKAPAEETPQAETKEAPQAKAEASAPAEKAAEAPAAEEPKKEKAAPAAEKAKEGEAPAAEKPKEGEAPAGDKPKGKEERRDVFKELGLDADEGAPKVLKAKGSKNVHAGLVHVCATFNNTIVTVTDLNGNTLGWSSAGKMGFRGSRKSTAYASQLVSQDACRQAMGHGLKSVEVRVKGPGSGRESAVRAIQAMGIEITLIKDVTPIPHNGCRPPKARRV